MSNVVFTDASGVERTATAQPGDSVMQTAKRNGIPGITAECGGALSCATCHVFVDERSQDVFEPMEELEDEMLWGTSEDREDNSRLSCQLPADAAETIYVTTPATQV